MIFPIYFRRHSQVREVVLQTNAIREQEQESLPLEQQPWYAGQLNVKTANERLEILPIGTFLVRLRDNGQFALMLKTMEKPKGVKSMKIEEEVEAESNQRYFYLSQARKFSSLFKLVTYYRQRDLTENFNYDALKGVSKYRD